MLTQSLLANNCRIKAFIAKDYQVEINQVQVSDDFKNVTLNYQLDDKKEKMILNLKDSKTTYYFINEELFQKDQFPKVMDQNFNPVLSFELNKQRVINHSDKDETYLIGFIRIWDRLFSIKCFIQRKES
jgi:hypothetical protein